MMTRDELAAWLRRYLARVKQYEAPADTRAERMNRIRRFLDSTGYAEATRKKIQGDASSRSYERLQLGDQRAILMNAPRRPDGPPVRDGKPYSAIVHLAEDVKPFVAMANGLDAEAGKQAGQWMMMAAISATSTIAQAIASHRAALVRFHPWTQRLDPAQDLDRLDDFDDSNLALSIHYYEPIEFTFNLVPHLSYPLTYGFSRWDMPQMKKRMEGYARFAQKKQRAIHVGE